jgi:5,10-methylenetetrahydrofolate reductase
VAFNPTAENLDAEVDKLRQKLEVGAHAFWTQPVFEIEALENALEKIEGINVELLLGLRPLRSACQAEFLHHEVPGINIPKYVRKKLAELNKEGAPKYGVAVAQNLLIEAKPLVSGAYLMPPASMPHLAGDVIEPII